MALTLALAAALGVPPSAMSAALYSMSRGTWTPVALAPSIVATCAAADDCQISGVGRHWLAISEQLCNHCSSPTVFQNLTTGQVRADPTAPTTLPDLSSPTLAAPVCSPLRLPRGTTLAGGERTATFGSLTFAGPFALATAGTVSPDGSGAVYLERCGSHLHTLVCHCSALRTGNVGTAVANSRVVIWAPPVRFATPVTHLDGMYLPSRRRFVIPLPTAARARGTEGVQLSSRTLYIRNDGDESHAFSARSPR